MAQFYSKKAIMLNDKSERDIYQGTDTGLILDYNLELVIDAVNNLLYQNSEYTNNFRLIKDRTGKSYKVHFVIIEEEKLDDITLNPKKNKNDFLTFKIREEIDTISIKFYQIFEMNDSLDVIEKKMYKLEYTPHKFQYVNSKILYSEDIKNFEKLLADDLFAIVKLELDRVLKEEEKKFQKGPRWSDLNSKEED